VLRFPAYGNKLWQRRLLGERPRVVILLVGNFWRCPPAFAADPEIPRLAVKTSPWHLPTGDRFDWRLVAACTVLAVDVRGPDERAEGPDGWDPGTFWDPWLWLLADVQRYARDVLRFTITEEFRDPRNAFSAQRDLECHAWCSRVYRRHALDPSQSTWEWPPWWPYGADIHERRVLQHEAAA
jgi:hypothetical protein